MKKKIAAIIAALALSLTGCGQERTPRPETMQPRDQALYTKTSIIVDIVDDTGLKTSSQAEWEVCGGVRHLSAYVSDTGASDGSGAVWGEAWSDDGMDGGAWLSVNGSGWQHKEYADGICDAPGVDLDAFFDVVDDMFSSDFKTAERSGSGDIAFYWDVPASDAAKISGGTFDIDGLSNEPVQVSALFSKDGIFDRFDVSIDAGGRTMSVTAYMEAWNEAGSVLEVPESVRSDSGGYDLNVENRGDNSQDHPCTYDESDAFDNPDLAALAGQVRASGKAFDLISLNTRDGFDEMLYYNSGIINGGYWVAAVSVEQYPDQDTASLRAAELETYNDALYGDEPGGGWYGYYPDDGISKYEMWQLEGDTVYGVQVEARSKFEIRKDDMSGIANDMFEDIYKEF